MKRVSALMLALLCLCACGGGGGDSPRADPPSVQSPGGIWLGNASVSAVVLYIAETGALRVQLSLPGAIDPSFGTGLVAVSSGGALHGSFELRPPEPVSNEQDDLGCSIAGTVAERQSMSVDISCADDNGIVYDESVTLNYDFLRYEVGSSLDELAGNYTLGFSPDTNTLDISSDGTLFGMYDNLARCTVNGRARIIDASYALIAIDWSFSACTDALGIFEGVEMSGFAMPNPSTNDPLDGFYFLLTGTTSRGLHVISVLYEPV